MENKLSDEQLNIAICEWRGWEQCGPLPSHITGIEALGNMHEAEKTLTEDQSVKYEDCLRSAVVNKEPPFHSKTWDFQVAHATARERAIAFLRVAGRCDARMDADGHCTVCGCEVREYEGGTDAEAMRAHMCPPGFRTTIIPIPVHPDDAGGKK